MVRNRLAAFLPFFCAPAAARASAPMPAMPEPQVTTAHAFTGRACAASRHEESMRYDALFYDPLAARLAGQEGLKSPMGEWIMVPRTRWGDDFLWHHYKKADMPCRQVVLLGAGMDARAFRLDGMPDLVYFEVDQETTFDVKEPLLDGYKPLARERRVVAADFTHKQGPHSWKEQLLEAGFLTDVPSVWLLEGLMMYLSLSDQKLLMRNIGDLSAPGSAIFHDAISANYLKRGINVMGAPFIGGTDSYGRLWSEEAGFQATLFDFQSVVVDRAQRVLRLSNRRGMGQCTEVMLSGKDVILFVEAVKPAKWTKLGQAPADKSDV
mmetsp:Transcript_9401/g.17030  ORF Transcript_9401/g.17030 Transcript_9401/m.17030 type:complete len:323 (+) Transcript_9401:18-986(+)